MLDIRNLVIDHAAGKDPIRIKALSKHMTLEAAEVIFDNCWRSMEDFLIIFALDNLEPSIDITILQTKEYVENKDHGERFGWFDTGVVSIDTS